MAQEEFLDDPMPDVIEQWRFYLSTLYAQNGDAVVDIGCGSGDAERLLLREYTGIGKVVGVDNKNRGYDRAWAKWQQEGRPTQLEWMLADAQDLPFPDGHFDRALCVDMLEWVRQPLQVLREIQRTLKPDGVAVIIHSDFDTQVFNATDNKLCRRIVHDFADAGPNGQMGRQLYGLCKIAGFRTVQPVVYTLVNTEWRPNLYAYKVAHMMVDWVASKALVPRGELERWLTDLAAQQERGLFFYSINRYICRCQK
jgi:ubiquinone/menaquinone biosynthesis C-methylase UbiE